jgi:hypothetical protein
MEKMLHNRLIRNLAIVGLIIGAAGFCVHLRTAYVQAAYQREWFTRNAISNLVSEIERLPQLPANAAELVQRTGKPLPTNAWGMPIHYHRYTRTNGVTNFIVGTMGGQIWIYRYDSAEKQINKIPF